MAKVKYYAKVNTKLGTYSFYAAPVSNGTLTFNEVCDEVCRNTSIEPSIMKAAVAEYMKTAKMLTANKGVNCLGASVSIKFFASKTAQPSVQEPRFPMKTFSMAMVTPERRPPRPHQGRQFNFMSGSTGIDSEKQAKKQLMAVTFFEPNDYVVSKTKEIDDKTKRCQERIRTAPYAIRQHQDSPQPLGLQSP